MKKPKPQTEWQQRNKDKTLSYTKKYNASRVKAGVTLTKEIAEKIDKIKPSEQSYGGWIRELVESYINSLE